MGIKPRRVPYPIRAARFLGLWHACVCLFQKCVNLCFLSREIYFCQLPCRNIAEEPARIIRPFRRLNERLGLNILFFKWVSLSRMQLLAGSQNSSLRATLGSSHRAEIIYENQAFPNCSGCIQQLSWDYFDVVWIDLHFVDAEKRLRIAIYACFESESQLFFSVSCQKNEEFRRSEHFPRKEEARSGRESNLCSAIALYENVFSRMRMHWRTERNV